MRQRGFRQALAAQHARHFGGAGLPGDGRDMAGRALGSRLLAHQQMVVGARGREGLENGDINHGVWSAGMIQGLIHDIPTCDELISRIVGEAEEIITGRLAQMVGAGEAELAAV